MDGGNATNSMAIFIEFNNNNINQHVNMKKYKEPVTKVVEVTMTHQLLAESNGDETIKISKGTTGWQGSDEDKPKYWDSVW